MSLNSFILNYFQFQFCVDKSLSTSRNLGSFRFCRNFFGKKIDWTDSWVNDQKATSFWQFIPEYEMVCLHYQANTKRSILNRSKNAWFHNFSIKLKNTVPVYRQLYGFCSEHLFSKRASNAKFNIRLLEKWTIFNMDMYRRSCFQYISHG